MRKEKQVRRTLFFQNNPQTKVEILLILQQKLVNTIEKLCTRLENKLPIHFLIENSNKLLIYFPAQGTLHSIVDKESLQVIINIVTLNYLEYIRTTKRCSSL
jgi:hypothetical protein